MPYQYESYLIVYGFLIYVLCLIQGFILGNFKNPRLALSTHVTGLMIGIFSIAVGSVGERIRLVQMALNIALFSHIVGNTLLVASLGLAASWNTQSKTPIKGGKFPASPFKEKVIKSGIILSSLLVLLSASIFLFGTL